MNRALRLPLPLVLSVVAAAALLVPTFAGAEPSGPDYQPSTAECQPGQPYNRKCPTIVNFTFPKQSVVKSGRAKLAHLGCNNSCNHVNYTAKHGRNVAAKGSEWFRGNYTPNLYGKLTSWAKDQLKEHGELAVTAKVCVHPPGPENFCKSGRVLIKAGAR
jgi:hypothetical protein